MPTELIWHEPAHPWLAELPSSLTPHLLDTGSLTARVRELSGGEASVTLLRHEHALPAAEEARRLNIAPDNNVLHRDIHLFGCPAAGQLKTDPWIFAHTVIPPGTLSGEGERLGRLGNQPLGEALFADPNIHRGGLQLAKLSAEHGLFQTAVQGLTTCPAYIWGRRSTFTLSNGASLLVAEFFLPGHPALSA